MMPRQRESLVAIGLTVAAVGLFACLDTTTKYVVQTVPVLMVLCVRYLVQALLSSAWLLPSYGRASLRMQQPRLLLLRGVLLLASSILTMFSLRLMPLADAVAIVMLAPVMVTVLSATVFRTAVGIGQWVCLVLGFSGVLLIVQPGGSQFGWAMLFPVGAMLVSVAYQLLSGHLGRTEHPAAVHFSTMWVGAILSGLLLPWGWTVVQSPLLWFLMVVMGLIGGVSHFLLTLAYRRASPSVVAPYVYVQVGFAVLLGWLVFGDFPDPWSQAGIALVILSGTSNAWLLRRAVSAR